VSHAGAAPVWVCAKDSAFGIISVFLTSQVGSGRQAAEQRLTERSVVTI
jgi:hypothetical protein